MDLRRKNKKQTLEPQIKPKRKKRWYGDLQVGLRSRTEKPKETCEPVSEKAERMRRYRDNLKKQPKQKKQI